jgi:hypothetical protein
VILLVERYIPSDEARLAELTATAAENERLGVFEEFLPLMNSGDRLRYGQAFRMCADRYPGRVCVLANADIRFDETARLLPFAVKSNRLVTLTRWESDATPRMIGHYMNERFYSGSQDVWAFVGGELVGIGDSIPLGYIGCDQAILGEAMLAGYEVVNPALSIKTRHVHAGGQRGPGELSVAGTYAYPELTTMHMTGSLVHHPWPQEDDDADSHA